VEENKSEANLNQNQLKEDLPLESQGQTAEPSAELLQEEISRLKDSLAKQEEVSASYLEQIKRLQADFENWRKRVEQEKLYLIENASAQLIQKLLPVLDNFERALSHADNQHEKASFKEGMELIYRQLCTLLREEGLTPIEAKGVVFDPNLHEAYAFEEISEGEDHRVIEEARKGYILKGRLLRPALVKVSKVVVKNHSAGG
jgi:molecular chaperone GrpE